MSYLEKAKRIRTQQPSIPEPLQVAKKAKDAKEASRTAFTLPEEVRNKTGTLPRLPWQLEALLRAASSDLLPKETVTLPAGLVPDLNRYTLAWGCSYLTGDRNEALRRLWQAHGVWQGAK